MQRISPDNQNFNDLDLIFIFFLNDTSTIFLSYLNGNFEEFLKTPFFLFTNIVRFFCCLSFKDEESDLFHARVVFLCKERTIFLQSSPPPEKKKSFCYSFSFED